MPTTGRVDEALAEFGRAIELDPRNVFAHSDRGSVLLSAARSTRPCRRSAARLLEYHRRYEGAERLYREAMDITPEDAGVRRRLAWFRRRRPG